MKAAILNKYDKKGTDVEIKEISIPEMGNNDVLVKICSALGCKMDDIVEIVPTKE